MAQVNSQDGAQPEMLPDGYPVSDEELRQMPAQQRGRTEESPAPDLAPDRESPSYITIILLGGALLLSATLVLLGAGSLLFGIVDLAGTLLMDRIDSYNWPWVLCPVGLGLVLLVPGVFWLRACIRRIRVLRASIPGPRVVLTLTGSCVFLVLLLALIAMAWVAKPINVVHFRLQYLAGRRSFQGIELHEAELSGADLSGADLSGADLTGATVTDEQLAQADTLEGATLPDGSVHE